jgi:hypothetical protein
VRSSKQIALATSRHLDLESIRLHLAAVELHSVIEMSRGGCTKCKSSCCGSHFAVSESEEHTAPHGFFFLFFLRATWIWLGFRSAPSQKSRACPTSTSCPLATRRERRWRRCRRRRQRTYPTQSKTEPCLSRTMRTQSSEWPTTTTRSCTWRVSVARHVKTSELACVFVLV